MGFRKAWCRNYKNRLMDYDHTMARLLKRIEELALEKQELVKLMELSPVSYKEEVCKTYIETGRLKDVTAWVNESGYRIESSYVGSRKYNINDISNFIFNEGNNQENRFAKEALKLFKLNTSHV